MAHSLASPVQSLDQLCINTVRTLAMDAVQKANSGHPGTPMALAPLAYAAVHAPPAPRSGRPGLARPRPLRALGRPRVDAALQRCCYLTGYDLSLDDLQAVPPVGEPHARAPGVRLHARRRDHHRPARPGRRQRGRHGGRRGAPRGASSTATGTRSSTTTRTSSPATAT